MELKKQLEDGLKEAMRGNDEASKRTIRMVISAIKLSEVEKGKPLPDLDILTLLHKEVKLRKEAMSEAQKANRNDLVGANLEEILVLEKFLPTQLTQEELETLALEVIKEINASGPSDMGQVMKAIMPRIQGRVAGDQLSLTVRRLLMGS